MDDLEELDLDRLQALIQVLTDGEVSEFTYRGMTIRRGAPQPRVENPLRPTIDGTTPPEAAPYAKLLGSRMPSGWPKAE